MDKVNIEEYKITVDSNIHGFVNIRGKISTPFWIQGSIRLLFSADFELLNRFVDFKNVLMR